MIPPLYDIGVLVVVVVAFTYVQEIRSVIDENPGINEFGVVMVLLILYKLVLN